MSNLTLHLHDEDQAHITVQDEPLVRVGQLLPTGEAVHISIPLEPDGGFPAPGLWVVDIRRQTPSLYQTAPDPITPRTCLSRMGLGLGITAHAIRDLARIVWRELTTRS